MIPVEAQLGVAALSVVGGSWAVIKHYASSTERRISGLEERLRIAERLDGEHQQEMLGLNQRLDQNARQNASQSTKLDKLGEDLRQLMVDFANWQGRLDERLDLRKEIRALIGRRLEDKDA